MNIVINLPHRKDRLKGFVQSFAEASNFATGEVSRLIVSPGVHVAPEDVGDRMAKMEGGGWRSADKLAAYKPRALGCLLAHRLALTRFLQSTDYLGLIFEDDARFVPGALETVSGLCISKPFFGEDGWLLMLDARYFGSPAPGDLVAPGVIRCHKARCASGVVYTRKAAEAILEASKECGKEFDLYLEDRCKTGLVYATSPSLCYQEGGFSDIHGMPVAYANHTEAKS